MMKTISFCVALFFRLISTESAFSQQHCFSMREYPYINTAAFKDSIELAKEMEWFAQAEQSFYQDMINCKMPKLNIETVEGDSLTNNRLLGKVVVINFWFKECAPCVEEIPALIAIKKHFIKDSVIFIGISKNSKQDIITFVKDQYFDYTMIADGNELSHAFALNGWPHTYIFDKRGRFKAIFGNIRNDFDQQQIERKIQELL